MSGQAKDSAGVIAPPPVIYAGFLALAVALEVLYPTAVFPRAVRLWLGFGLIGVGAVLAALVVRAFRRARTSLDVRKPTAALVTDGPFRISRNPAYLALNLLCAGAGIAGDSLWVLAMLVPALLVLHYGVIRREERYLAARFGDEYTRYRRTVRRWL